MLASVFLLVHLALVAGNEPLLCARAAHGANEAELAAKVVPALQAGLDTWPQLRIDLCSPQADVVPDWELTIVSVSDRIVAYSLVVLSGFSAPGPTRRARRHV